MSSSSEDNADEWKTMSSSSEDNADELMEDNVFQ